MAIVSLKSPRRNRFTAGPTRREKTTSRSIEIEWSNRRIMGNQSGNASREHKYTNMQTRMKHNKNETDQELRARG